MSLSALTGHCAHDRESDIYATKLLNAWTRTKGRRQQLGTWYNESQAGAVAVALKQRLTIVPLRRRTAASDSPPDCPKLRTTLSLAPILFSEIQVEGYELI